MCLLDSDKDSEDDGPNEYEIRQFFFAIVQCRKMTQGKDWAANHN